jgi:hypothetical protein
LGLIGGSQFPEPHSDGEIWGQTLWQLRQALAAKYGQIEGSNRAERDITATGARSGHHPLSSCGTGRPQRIAACARLPPSDQWLLSSWLLRRRL